MIRDWLRIVRIKLIMKAERSKCPLLARRHPRREDCFERGGQCFAREDSGKNRIHYGTTSYITAVLREGKGSGY